MAEVLDPQRLAAIASYDILDTVPEEGFDDVVQLARQLCDAPVALVSLVAADRQWFKARAGFPLCETDLDSSVCIHALAEPDLVVIEDLTRDPRTSGNPLVVGEPFIRFYAGAPLRTAGGAVLGTLCVIDTVPRPAGLAEAQADALRRLARQVMNLLELRKAVRQREVALVHQEVMVQQHRALLDAQHAVGAAGGDLDTVFAALTVGAMRALPQADGGVVELIDGDDLVYHSPQGSIRDRAGLRVPLQGTLAGRAVSSGRPLRVTDVRTEADPPQDLLARLGVRSCLAVPIARSGEVVGVLKLQSRVPGAFGEEDLQVARLFAGEAVTGLAKVGEADARRATRTSENRYRSVFDSITDFALIVTDREGRVTEWNTGAERILGWTATEMRGHDVERMFTPEDRAIGVPATERRTSLERGRAPDERWHVRRDGSRFWASGELMPLRAEEGGHLGFVKVLRDRTTEHLAGRALEEAEVRLRESEDHLRHTVELNPAVPWTCDPQGNITSHSKRWLDLTGQAPGEPDGAGWMKALHPDDVASTAAVFATCLASGEPVDVDYRIRVATTDDYRWMRARAHPRRDADGAIMRWYGVVEDVHDSKVTEAALRQSEERFRTILDTIEAAFAIVQVKFDADDQPIDYRFLEANPAFERQAGVDLRGKWVTEFAPDLERFWFETYGWVAQTGEPATFESYAEGFGRWFDVRAVRVGDPADRQIAIFFSDVTARRKAEERLRASEMLARANIERVQLALAAGAIIGTWHWDLPTDRFTVDESFARSSGLDPALGLDGIALAQIVATVHPDDQADLAAAMNEAIARGGGFAHQFRVRRADGRYYWIEANGRVDHGPDRAPLSFPGVLLDVEKRRAVEQERDRAIAALRALNDTLEQRVEERTEELMRAEEALRQSQKMEAVGQLTGGVAHDFNNLLTIIRSSIDLLRRPDLPEERRRRYIDAVSETVDRAAKLTGQLLAFARRQALKPEAFDVGKRLGAIADMLDTVTGARIKVVTELSDVPCFIKADLSQFETALVNMAVNARDAMDGAGQITLRLTRGVRMPPIRGHAGADGPFVAVSLSDTGEGIPPERLSRIFEPFFTTKEVGKGTGLGLSQVFGFAKQSGGDVDVRSEVGRGTTFTLYLPEVEVEASPVSGEQGPDELSDGAGLRVLVVEDNIEVGQFATQILQDLGYVTTWAANAEEALTWLGKDGAGFDVVFSDVVMPGMGGLALARELQQRLPTMPVVLASGYSHVLAQEGAHGFELLNKPYSADHLSRTLRRVIRR